MAQNLFTQRNLKSFITLCMLLLTSIAFAQKTVHVETAGTLKDKLSEEEMFSLTELTLTGELNGTDFNFIRAMAGSTVIGEVSDGKLQVLDISGANILAGGDSYYYINEELEYYTIDNTISVNMFCRCGQLRKVTLPNSVTTIEKNAFLQCENLTDIIVKPENKNFKTIDGVLFDNSMTTLLKCPDGKTGTYTIPEGTLKLSDEAFSNAGKLEKVVIPASLNSIGGESGSVPFYICDAMKEFEVHKDNKTFASIDGVLFDKNLEILLKYPKGRSGEYVVPETVKKVGRYSFYEVHELMKVTLPKSVTEIESSAFAHIKKLTSITLPENLTQIGFGVFMDCTGLSEVHVLADEPPYCGTMAFYNLNFDQCKLFVPHGRLSIYQTTEPWSQFKNVVEAEEKAYVTFTTPAKIGSQIACNIVGEDMTFDGIKFLESKDVLGEIIDFYEVMKPEVRIEGNITELNISNFSVTALDVSHCPMLKLLNCKNCKPEKLDLTKNVELVDLNCSYCGLKELDITHCEKLSVVDCDENEITKLDVGKNLLLNTLFASNNEIGSIDLSALKYLEVLALNSTGLETLDITNNPYLQKVYANDNKLSELDLTKNTNIQELQLAVNNFTSFSLSSATLKELYINDNKLKTMNLDLPVLELLCAYGNEMTEIDLSKLKKLNTLSIHHNLLTDINLKPLEQLEYIWIDNNKLEALDLSKNPIILTIACYSNQLSANACKLLMTGLPERDESDMAEIIIVDTKGTEGNVCTKSAVEVARAKQWNVIDYIGGTEGYPGLPYAGVDDVDAVQGIAADGDGEAFVIANGKIIFNGNCGRVSLYDAQGAEVSSLNNPTMIDLSGMPHGVYIVKCNGISKKFVR